MEKARVNSYLSHKTQIDRIDARIAQLLDRRKAVASAWTEAYSLMELRLRLVHEEWCMFPGQASGNCVRVETEIVDAEFRIVEE